MATTTKLVMNFTTASGTKSVSIGYVDYDSETSDAQDYWDVANAFVTNGSIFSEPPLAVKSVKIVTSETVDIEQPAG